MKVNEFDWKNAKVLVTGASGFKGSWLCASLIALDSRVYGTVRDQVHPDSLYKILDLDSRISKINIDITERQQVNDMINSIEPDVIFHLAAKALVPVSLRDPRRTFNVNITGTLNIIEACRKLKVCNRLLICSTDHVFGIVKSMPAEGLPETERVSYGGPYDTSKAAMELLVRSYHSTYWSEVPAIGITRCANVFGYGDVNQRRVIPLFVNSAVNNIAIPLKYRQNGRQFIHITDAIAGYIRAISSLDEGDFSKKQGRPIPDRTPFTPTFHFAIETYGHSEPYIRMEELARTVSRLFNVSIDDKNAVDLAPRENPILALNCRSTREALGWTPKKSLEEGLKDLSEWFKCNTEEARKRIIWKDVDHIIDSLR